MIPERTLLYQLTDQSDTVQATDDNLCLYAALVNTWGRTTGVDLRKINTSDREPAQHIAVHDVNYIISPANKYTIGEGCFKDNDSREFLRRLHRVFSLHSLGAAGQVDVPLSIHERGETVHRTPVLLYKSVKTMNDPVAELAHNRSKKYSWILKPLTYSHDHYIERIHLRLYPNGIIGHIVGLYQEQKHEGIIRPHPAYEDLWECVRLNAQGMPDERTYPQVSPDRRFSFRKVNLRGLSDRA